MRWRRAKTNKRPRDRGIAAVEFALSLSILMPILLGTIDYGYYFYISVNVAEAQRAGLLAASRVAVGDCSASATAAQVAAKSAAQGLATTTEQTYLKNANGVPTSGNGLMDVVTLVNNSPTCSNTPLNPTWSMSMSADFRPIIGWVAPWMKHSTTAGWARYTAPTLVMLGK